LGLRGSGRTLQDNTGHSRTLHDNTGHCRTLQNTEHCRTIQDNTGHYRTKHSEKLQGLHCPTVRSTVRRAWDRANLERIKCTNGFSKKPWGEESTSQT